MAGITQKCCNSASKEAGLQVHVTTSGKGIGLEKAHGLVFDDTHGL